MRHNLLVILILSNFLAITTFAFKLSPMSVELSAKGKKATKSFRVINTSPEKIKVEAQMYNREIDILNKETRTETSEFTVFPPQLVVDPGKSRVIRVSYLGEAAKNEKAYRLVVRQIPNSTKKKKEGAQINFLFEYVASVYITPEKAKPKLNIESSIKAGDHIELIFTNAGTKHVLLRRYKLELSQGDKKKIIDFKKKFYEKEGSQNILSGLRRKIFINDSTFSTGKVKAAFKKK